MSRSAEGGGGILSEEWVGENFVDEVVGEGIAGKLDPYLVLFFL